MIRPTHFVLLLVLLSHSPIAEQAKPFLVIWNVGQGQWVSHIESTFCLHFDMGGERISWQNVKFLCGHKNNLAILSHWDWDHINFVHRSRKRLDHLCVLLPPQGRSNARKRRVLRSIPPCTKSFRSPKLPLLNLNLNPLAQTTNDQSRVLLWLQQILLSGDTSIKQERIWLAHHSFDTPIRLIVLGHHGSRSSTGSYLLQKISRITQAIASARQSRYGHPHREVKARLQKSRIPLLSTEQWGTIRVDYNL